MEKGFSERGSVDGEKMTVTMLEMDARILELVSNAINPPLFVRHILF